MIDWSAVPRRAEHRQLGPRPPWFNGGPISQIAIDPRGRYFATMGSRGGRLFHAATGELVATLEGSTNAGSETDSFAFTDEGRVIGLLADKVIRQWDAPSGALVRAFEDVACDRLCGVDARGERVLVRDENASPVVVDLATGARKRMSTRPFGGVGGAAFVAGGRVLGLSSGDDNVFCWDASSGEERWRVSHARFGSAIVAPARGDWFAIGGKAGGALICDVASGAARDEVESPDAKYWVRGLSATSDGRRLLVAMPVTFVYDLPARSIVDMIPDPDRQACVGALAPDGTWCVLGYEDGELRSTNAGAGVAFEGHRARIDAVLFDAAGDVVARDRSGRTLTWPAGGGAPRAGGVFPAEKPPAPWAAAREREIDQAITRSYLTSDYGGLSALYANETLALSLDNYGVYRIWRRDATDSVELDPGTAPGSPVHGRVTTAILHPDGRHVAAGTTRADAPIQLWDGVEGRPVAILEGSESSVEAVAFDATGKRLAAGGLDRVVRIWSLAELPR